MTDSQLTISPNPFIPGFIRLEPGMMVSLNPFFCLPVKIFS